jgi:hypothetical protein
VYDNPMKTEPRTPEFQRFDRAMRDILKVSKTDLKQMLEEEKIANAGKPKRGPKPKHSSASGHASGEQG